MADITMPQLGETVTEGTITKWFKQVGDEIGEDEVLFEVSTDKVDSEVPSPVVRVRHRDPRARRRDGRRRHQARRDRRRAADGSGEATKEAEPSPNRRRSPSQRRRTRTRPSPSPRTRSRSPKPKRSPSPRRSPRRRPSRRPRLRGRQAKQLPRRSRAEGSAGRGRSPSGAEQRDGKLLSPVVRRLIAEHGLDPGTITGTGAGGRITRNDVLAVIEKDGGAKAEKAPADEGARCAGPAAGVRAAPRRAAPPGADHGASRRARHGDRRFATSASARPST